MNYYEHHLGDFMRDTAHLSMMEECAYRRLLDAYYIRERALPLDLRECCKLARAVSKAEREAVAYVIREFFQQAVDGHHQGRADREIERYRSKREKAVASVNQRWARERESKARAHNEGTTDAIRTYYEGNTDDIHRAPVPRHQTPDTIQTPPTPSLPAVSAAKTAPRKRVAGSVHGFPPGFERFWSGYPRKVAKTAAAQAFTRLKPGDALIDAMLAALRRQCADPEWLKDDGRYIPHAATWLNGRRWEDDANAAAPGRDLFAGAV